MSPPGLSVTLYFLFVDLDHKAFPHRVGRRETGIRPSFVDKYDILYVPAVPYSPKRPSTPKGVVRRKEPAASFFAGKASPPPTHTSEPPISRINVGATDGFPFASAGQLYLPRLRPFKDNIGRCASLLNDTS